MVRSAAAHPAPNPTTDRAAEATTDPSLAVGELAARLRVEIGRLKRQIRQNDQEGFTPSQISALASLGTRGPMRLGELARVECVAPPTLTKLIGGLESAGLVERSPDPTDGRSALVGLTRSGRAALTRVRNERTAFLAERISRLSPTDRARVPDVIELLTRLADPEAGA
jgi:DNA-binding MarR family transcriptional regulator